MANTKVLPDIQGTEAISATWRRLLVRDRNVSNFFSGNSFTTDQTSEDIGRPNWRTDLNRLFIFDGANFVSLWKYLTPDEITYNIDHLDIPEGVENVRQVLDIIVNRNNLNTITMPAEGTTYIADGVTTDFELSRYTNNKFSVYIFIDGVKQNSETYELSEDGLSVKFKRAPANGESIEIMQLASLAEWDYSPVIKNFVGDGANKTFDMGVDVLNTSITSVNVNGREYQKSEFSLDASGRKIVLENAPEEGAKVQISIIGKTSFVTVSPNSIGTEELKDGSVTVEKLAGALPINVNNIEDGSLTTRMIANKAITSAKLNDSAVTTTKINNRAVTEDKLSDDVKGRLLSTGNVTTSNLGDKVVTESKLSDDIKERLLSTGNVITSNLGDGSVTKEKLSSAVISEIEGKQEKLVAGENIKIEDNVISSTAGVIKTAASAGSNVDNNGVLQGVIRTQQQYNTDANVMLLSKGTIENIKEILVTSVGDNKYQTTINDLETIRVGAKLGETALQSYSETDPIYSADKPNIALKSELPTLARANVPGLVAGGNWLTVNQTTGKMECGELTKTQYDSALGHTFISKTTLENVLNSRTVITKSNNQSGNIKYSDGRMEQWGLATTSNTGETEFTMSASFIDTNYQVFVEPRQAGDLVHYAIPSAVNKFKARIQNTSGAYMACQFQWRAYGFWK